MKLAFILLACFVAVSLQQNPYWRSPASFRGLANYYGIPDYGYPYPAVHPYQDDEAISYHFRNQAEDGINSVASARQGIFANLLKNIQMTTTTFSTTVSTITAPSIVTCYTSTMFLSLTACRRKRNIRDIISVGDVNGEGPTKHEAVNSVMDSLPREGRDIDLGDLIESSIKGESVSDGVPQSINLAKMERQLFGNRVPSISTTTVTSTVTSYSLSYSTSTLTNTKLAASSALSCLPSGFQAC